MTWQPGEPLTLETERFIVRSTTIYDVTDAMVAWMADPEVMITLNSPGREMTVAQLKRQVKRYDNKRGFHLTVFDRASHEAIGFYTVNCKPWHRTAETAVVIGNRDYWGRNVVIETRSAILDFLFDTMELHKVTGLPFARNFPSVFNYKALGFRCEGVFREHLRSVEGGRLDQCLFGLLRDEWHAHRETLRR